jgi:hypothetical protein
LQWRKLWKKKWVALHGSEIVYMDKEPTLENASTMTITKAQVCGVSSQLHIPAFNIIYIFVFKITAVTEITGEDLEKDPSGFCIQVNIPS